MAVCSNASDVWQSSTGDGHTLVDDDQVRPTKIGEVLAEFGQHRRTFLESCHMLAQIGPNLAIFGNPSDLWLGALLFRLLLDARCSNLGVPFCETRSMLHGRSWPASTNLCRTMPLCLPNLPLCLPASANFCQYSPNLTRSANIGQDLAKIGECWSSVARFGPTFAQLGQNSAQCRQILDEPCRCCSRGRTSESRRTTPRWLQHQHACGAEGSKDASQAAPTRPGSEAKSRAHAMSSPPPLIAPSSRIVRASSTTSTTRPSSGTTACSREMREISSSRTRSRGWGLPGVHIYIRCRDWSSRRGEGCRRYAIFPGWDEAEYGPGDSPSAKCAHCLSNLGVSVGQLCTRCRRWSSFMGGPKFDRSYFDPDGALCSDLDNFLFFWRWI